MHIHKASIDIVYYTYISFYLGILQEVHRSEVIIYPYTEVQDTKQTRLAEIERNGIDAIQVRKLDIK